MKFSFLRNEKDLFQPSIKIPLKIGNPKLTIKEIKEKKIRSRRSCKKRSQVFFFNF